MATDLFSLKGKRALVTGGSRGIGRAIAKGFAAAGAEVGIITRQRMDLAEELVEELRGMGREQSFAVAADVAKREDVERAVEHALDRWGAIDVLVNNAGICINAPAEAMTEEQWDAVVGVNLKGVFLCAQRVGREMIRQRSGAIINVGSMSGFIVNYPQKQCAYNASKAAVHMLTKCLASEWAPYNVRVNAIAPGYIRTELVEAVLRENPGDTERYWVGGAVQARIGRPEELVGAAIYLASDASSFTTGEVVVIDGGYTLR